MADSCCRPIHASIRTGASTGAGRREEAAHFPHLSLRSGQRREPARRQLRDRHGRLRPDGPRCADQDKERDRSDAVVPPLLPRGHLRLLRDEHRRRQHAGVHAGLRGHRQSRGPDLPVAAHAGGEGPGAGPHAVLRAVRRGEAVAADPHAGTRRIASAPSQRKTRKGSTGPPPASCAPAVRLPARATGGTRTATWDPRRCSPPTAGSSTAATRRPGRGSMHWKTLSGSIAAIRS